MSDDLGPFAIRRIERRNITSAPATALAEHAAEAFVDRANGDLVRGSEADAQVTEAILARSGALESATLTPLLDSLSRPSSALGETPASPRTPTAAPAPSDATTSLAPEADDPLKPLLGDYLPPPVTSRPV